MQDNGRGNFVLPELSCTAMSKWEICLRVVVAVVDVVVGNEGEGEGNISGIWSIT